jgi:hypothetical protein
MKKAVRLKTRILEDGGEVRFVAKTEKYGVAEFVFCLRYERGKLKRVFITPAQQADVTEKFEIDASYKPLDFQLSAYTHKGMDEPRAWIYFWCEEHKAFAFRAYAPTQATHFTVQKLSSLCVTFEKDQ